MTRWDEHSDLWLFTPDELDQLPSGTEVVSNLGKRKIKGQDELNNDVRWGLTAWGIYDPWNHPLKELFTFFQLKS
jgi:hypothetical protein